MIDQARIETVAQALSDAHIADWGGQTVPLDSLCDAAYWRKLATAALEVLEAS